MLENSGYSITQLISLFNDEERDEHKRNVMVLACISVYKQDKNLDRKHWFN